MQFNAIYLINLTETSQCFDAWRDKMFVNKFMYDVYLHVGLLFTFGDLKFKLHFDPFSSLSIPAFEYKVNLCTAKLVILRLSNFTKCAEII